MVCCVWDAKISMSWGDAVAVTNAVLEQANVLPAGLGARDS
jgi:glycine cleavage system aminomethyltransferase T